LERKKIEAIGKNALLEYLSDNTELSRKVSAYFDTCFKSNEVISSDSIEKTPKKERVNEGQSLASLQKIISGKEISIDNILNFYFDKNKKFPFERLLNEILLNFETNLIELSHKMRFFELQGNIKHIMDYGCYVLPQSFIAEKLLFLHKNQITDKQEVNHPNEVLKEGDIITFRIIGINQQNYRLNISCLDSFKPENSAVPTDE
jgi:hypothetical protein